MSDTQQEGVSGFLNETRMAIHKHEMGAEDFQTLRGLTYHLVHGQPRMIQVKRAIGEFDADNCDRCFEDGRGY